MYELRYDAATEAVWDALPDRARQAFDTAILATCQDPYEATEPYGEDDKVMRMLTADDVMAVLLINHAPRKTVRILQLAYLG